MDNMVRVILLGAPGAGKGTQADAIEMLYDFKQISTGDLIRTEVKNDTEIGQQVKQKMKNGELIPDQIVIELLKNRLNQSDISKGYILDGFPRNRNQAEEVSKMKVDRELVIYLDVNENAVIKRLLSRLTCPNSKCAAVFNILSDPPKQKGLCDQCGSSLIKREDDNEKTIRHRIKVYKDQTHPVIEYYKNKNYFYRIDASLPVDEVFSSVKGVLN